MLFRWGLFEANVLVLWVRASRYTDATIDLHASHDIKDVVRGGKKDMWVDPLYVRIMFTRSFNVMFTVCIMRIGVANLSGAKHDILMKRLACMCNWKTILYIWLAAIWLKCVTTRKHICVKKNAGV